MYRGEWKNSKHNGQGIELDARGQVVYDGKWVDHKPFASSFAETSSLPPPPTYPHEIAVAPCDYDDCSTIAMSVAEGSVVVPLHEQQLRSSQLRRFQGRLLSEDDMLEEASVNRGSPTNTANQNNNYRYRFATAVAAMPSSTAGSARRPSPIQQGKKKASEGEQPALAPFEGLPEISQLIQTQREALEKCNASHRRQQQQAHQPRSAYVGN